LEQEVRAQRTGPQVTTEQTVAVQALWVVDTTLWQLEGREGRRVLVPQTQQEAQEDQVIMVVAVVAVVV
jgi:hypothetical protein